MLGCQLQQQQHHQQQQPIAASRCSQAKVQLPRGATVARPTCRAGRYRLRRWRQRRRRWPVHGGGHGAPAVQQRQRCGVAQTVAHDRLADGRADGADSATGQGAVRAVRPVEVETGRRVHEEMRGGVALRARRGQRVRGHGGRGQRVLHTAAAGQLGDDGCGGRPGGRVAPRSVPGHAPGRATAGTARPETVRGGRDHERHADVYGRRGRALAASDAATGVQEERRGHGHRGRSSGVRFPGTVPGRRPSHLGQSRVTRVRGRRAGRRLCAPRPRRTAARPHRGRRRGDRRRLGRLDTLQRRMGQYTYIVHGPRSTNVQIFFFSIYFLYFMYQYSI